LLSDVEARLSKVLQKYRVYLKKKNNKGGGGKETEGHPQDGLFDGSRFLTSSRKKCGTNLQRVTYRGRDEAGGRIEGKRRRDLNG